MFAERISGNIPSPLPTFDHVYEKVSLFGGLSQSQIETLVGSMSLVSFDRGDTIYSQGQLPCNIYILLSGKVELNIYRKDGNVGQITYNSGDCFGETALIGIQPQVGETTALDDTWTLQLSRTSLLELTQYHGDVFALLMMNVAREVSRRLHEALSIGISEGDAAKVHSVYGGIKTAQ
ncbi:MAG: CRP/FNR family cyclic AMP-dependent transcriptional regulator [Lentisphaeria bacterium]|jgi:CRP/FNR family cyclic AMP-dependent transcriptional regulator